MSYFPANSTKRKDICHDIPAKPWKSLVQTCSIKLPLYCRLSQQVPCHQNDGRFIIRQSNTDM